MKMNAPGTPPAHRLPVLTEVIQLTAATEEPTASTFGEVDFPLPVDEPVAIAVPVVAAPVPQPAVVPQPAPEPRRAPEPVLAEQPVPFAHDAPAPPEWLKRRPSQQVRVGLPLPAMAPPSPLPADFSGSWWSRDEGPAVVSSPVPVPVPIPAPVRPVESVSEDVLVQRVFEGLEGQIDLMFDHRMREAVVPALARAADRLMEDLKQQLHATLHEMVSRAVAIELARQAHRRESGS